MKHTYAQAETPVSNWCETLCVALDFAFPNLFNIEWLIDKAERGDWGGPWS